MRLKLSAKQALEFIKKLGVDAEIVADDQQVSEDDYNAAFTAVDNTRSPIFKPTLEQELRQKLTTELAGKHGGALRAQIRRLANGALQTSDLENLKDEEALQKLVETVAGQKNQSLEELREQIRKQLADFDTEKVKITTEKDAEYAKLKKQYIERDIDSIYETVLGEVPLIGGDKKTLAALAKSYVRNQFADHYDETSKKFELRELGNPEKIALKGNTAVQLKDVLTEFAKNTGILKTDMRLEDPNKFNGDGDRKHNTTQFGSGNKDVTDAVASLQSQFDV